MITSRLTSKAQTTSPQAVRAALKLEEGNVLLYRIEGKKVILTKARPAATGRDAPFRVFGEWNSEADVEAYGRL